MAEIRLTEAAAADLAAIADFGFRRFGEAQTRHYQRLLSERLDRISRSPQMYPAVDHVRPGYRRAVFQAHAIFYRVEERGVLIVRILGRQDARTGLGQD
jgi:toxin ParE1/3/4